MTYETVPPVPESGSEASTRATICPGETSSYI